jgi:hypothetical protein
MALLDGKQLRDQSTGLGKLSGTGIVTFTSATMSFEAGSILRTSSENITSNLDVVNKEYVDSVASGLDPKQSVAYTTTGDITLSGTGTQSGGDWDGVLSVGTRILVKDQDDATENGIYVVASGSWSRSSDHDGTPANEVTLGNYTFVEYGTYAGSGYVLYTTDSATTPLVTPGTDTQLWTLFSQAGAYSAGTGLTKTAAGAGSEFSITNTGVTANSYGQANSVATFTVNEQGQLTAAGETTIDITASQVNDFDSAAETAIFEDANFVDGTTIDFTVTEGDSVTAEVIDASLQVSKLNTGTNGGATAGYVLSTDGTNFKWVLDEGDISSVTAGAGLTGGGTTGALTLEVNTSNGLSISGDDVVLGGTLSQATTIDGDGLDLTIQNVDWLLLNSTTAFDVNSNLVSIDSGTGPTQLLSGTDTTIFASASINLVSEEGNVTTGNLEGLVYTADYSATFVDESLITKRYVDAGTTSLWNAINNIDADFVSEITAGAGLTGGGTEGTINLDIVSANGGIVVNADDIELTLGAGNSGALTIEGDGLTLNTTTLADELEGTGLTSSAGKLSVTSANAGIAVNTDGIELTLGAGNSGALTIEGDGLTLNTTTLADELEGTGLTSNAGKLSVNTANGLSISGDDVVLGGTITQAIVFNDARGGTAAVGLEYASDYSANFTANSLVNKAYVDSIASGLDPKESVAYTTTGDITLSGTGTQSGGDWTSSLTEGDRILVKDQTTLSENGIYVVASGAWSRATDHDGTPSNEVTLGNFTFVEEGTIYSGTGWVLVSTDSATTPEITPGTDTQVWTLFSQAGAYSAGTGLTKTAAGAGSEFSITNTGVTAAAYGQANSVSTFTVNAQGQLTVAGETIISITSSQVSDFDTAAQASIFTEANFVDGTTIDFTVTSGDSVTAEVIDSSLQVSKLNTGTNGGATAGYVLSTDGTNFKWVLDEGDISSVTAGAGLTGGGSEGALTFDIVSANAGIVVNADDIELTLGAGNSGALTIEGDGLTLNTTTLADELEGTGLTSSGGKLSVTSANAGIAVNTDGIELTLGAGNSGALTIEVDGLTLNTTTLADELEGAGLTSSGGKLSADLTTNGGLTFSTSGDAGSIEVVVDNTTIQVVNGALTVVAGASQPVYQSATSSVATGNTGITLTSTPNDYSRIQVYVNGQLQNLTENTTGDCYFGVSGTAFASLVSGDSLYWDATNAGFTLSATDIIKIHYEA